LCEQKKVATFVAERKYFILNEKDMKRFLFAVALLFIGLQIKCEIINGTLPDVLQFSEPLLLSSELVEDDASVPPKVVLPSPQSQLFEKYVNHKISEYNGLPDITIPLYEIEIKGLKIPIALTYHASGIKYKQFDGEVGAGWSINAGGYRVTRTVYGRADDLCDFYSEDSLAYYNNTAIRNAYLARMGIDNSLSIHGDEPQNTIISRGGFLWPITSLPNPVLLDGEYDQFTYMLPSSSGHFIITDRNTRATAIANPIGIVSC
jgi:hypothetical protein